MKVFLVQHSHSDPGYTHPRDEVWRHQLRNIALSVEFARHDPDYRWTVECFWMIDEAMRRGCPLPEGFLELARRGRIALTATYLNGSDHLDAEDFRRMLRVSRAFCDAHAIPLRTAMQCDVNGVNGCMPDLLHEIGVTRMAFAINDERGGAPFARPNAFYWRGPAGGRILVFNGFVYLKANEYGMHRGFVAFCDGAKKLMEDLRHVEYRLPVCLLQGCGTYDDNGLAAPWMAEMSRAWGRCDDGDGVEFVCATIDEFFDALESCGADFPEYSGTWPDWWSDGLASAPLELKRACEARRKLRSIEPLLDPSATHVGGAFEAAQRDVWMYLEHTFGSWRSVGEPDAPDTRRQWADKSVFAHRALEEASFLVEDTLAGLAEGDACLRFPPDCAAGQFVSTQVPREDFPESGEILFERNPARARAWVIVPREPQAMATLLVWAEPPGDTLVTLRRRGFEPQAIEADLSGEAHSVEGEDPMPALVCETLHGTRQQLRYADPSVRLEQVQARTVDRRIVRFAGWSAVHCVLEAPGWRELALTACRWRDPSACEYVLSGVKAYDEAPHACFLVLKPVDRPAEIWAESGGFWHRPGVDELPGACRDWHVVQQGVEIRAREGETLAFWTPDAPVIHFGGINTGKWGQGLDPANGTLAVCLHHNYWYVNFPAAAPGRLSFRFRIARGPGLDARALLSSWNNPFLVYLDSPRARQLRARRLSRISGEAIR